jgi:hypothetical protein
MKIYQLSFLLGFLAGSGVIITDQGDTISDSGKDSTSISNGNNVGSFNKGPTIVMQNKSSGGSGEGSAFFPWGLGFVKP